MRCGKRLNNKKRLQAGGGRGKGSYVTETNRATKSCAKRISDGPQAVTKHVCTLFA